MWWVVCGNLSVHWLANPVYSYGWLVPAVGCYTAIERWKTRPEASAPCGAGRWAIWLSAVAFLPTWAFAQPNPDWSLIAWLLSGEAVAMTMGAVVIAGGKSWAWHFAFPICFIFLAVPCPHVIEVPMSVGLMRGVASLTVELLNVFGFPAVQHGNLIEIKNGVLGVEHACSGVRSLQAALTASVFVGELVGSRLLPRLVLAFVGLVVAVITNVCRTFLLAWKASSDGLIAVQRWHDSAGFVTLGICFGVIWIAAVMMARGDVPCRVRSSVAPARLLPPKLMLGLAAWIVMVLLAVEFWFHEGKDARESSWTLLPPAYSIPIAVADGVLEQLQCDKLQASAWRETDGSDWLMYFLEWRSGPIRSRVLARVHRPEICLSSIGLRMIQDRGTLWVEADGYRLLFHAYTFEQDGKPMFVYYGIWQNRSRAAEESGVLSESEHLAGVQAVIWRERNLGQQVAELAVTGYNTPAEADAGLESVLKKLLVRKPPAAG